MTARMPSAYGRNRRADNGGWGAQSAPAMVHWKGAAWPSIQKQQQQQQQQQVAAAVTPPPTQARASKSACMYIAGPSQVWVPNHVAAIVFACKMRSKGKRKGRGGGRVGVCRPWVGWEQKGKPKGCVDLPVLPACLPAWKRTTTCLHTWTTYYTCVHAYRHTHTHTLTYIHTLTCVSRIPHGRERG